VGKGKRTEGNRGENDLTHLLSQIPGYATVSETRNDRGKVTMPSLNIHCESEKKLGHFYFYCNFGKCGPISIILSLLDS